jgi:hypothetical protein
MMTSRSLICLLENQNGGKLQKGNSGYLAAISLATVPVTPMTFVKFNFKFANPSKNYEIHKTRIRRFGVTRGNSRPAR